MPSSSVARPSRAALWAAAVSAVAVIAGVAAPVNASNEAARVNGDAMPFDIDKIPFHVLDDATVVVEGAGLLIDEPEPFAGLPAVLVESAIQAMQAATTEERSLSTSEAPSASQAFTLHSNPGANRTIFLDFDGHTTSGTAWNTNGRPASFTSAPYSRDSNPAFNSTELLSIGEIWEQVAEDYAPFNVDVTTEEPSFDALWRSSSTDQVYGTRVVVSPTQDWYGSSGGVAYVGSFSWSNVRTPAGDPVVTPAFVFSDSLASGFPKYVGEAAAHEVGHTLSLYHDGKDGSSYYGGHAVAGGSTSSGWAPIMGVGYQRDVTQWSNGDYPGATELQDDIAILASRLGWASSTSTVVGPATLVDGQSIVGTVESSSKSVDVEIAVVAGTTSITIVPDVDDSNLLVSAQLLDASTVIAQASPTSAAHWQLGFSEVLSAGTYTVRLSSIGWGSITADNLNGFSKYGSIGRYRMSLTVAPSQTTTTTTTPTTTTTVAPPSVPLPDVGNTTTTTTPTTTTPTTSTTTPATTTTTSTATSTTTTPTTSTTSTTTPATTTTPPDQLLSGNRPVSCDAQARSGLFGSAQQQTTQSCLAPAQRLG